MTGYQQSPVHFNFFIASQSSGLFNKSSHQGESAENCAQGRQKKHVKSRTRLKIRAGDGGGVLARAWLGTLESKNGYSVEASMMLDVKGIENASEPSEHGQWLSGAAGANH